MRTVLTSFVTQNEMGWTCRQYASVLRRQMDCEYMAEGVSPHSPPPQKKSVASRVNVSWRHYDVRAPQLMIGTVICRRLTQIVT
jgi:hypothetical protein